MTATWFTADAKYKPRFPWRDVLIGWCASATLTLILYSTLLANKTDLALAIGVFMSFGIWMYFLSKRKCPISRYLMTECVLSCDKKTVIRLCEEKPSFENYYRKYSNSEESKVSGVLNLFEMNSGRVC
jgi:hypothetical protein